MRCTLAAIAGTSLLASALLTAADFWQEKDFTLWTTQQAEKMLVDSPWAKVVQILVGRISDEGFSGFQGGGAGLGGGGDVQRDSAGNIKGIGRVPVTVAWISALPVRQALIRLRASPARVPPDQRQLADNEPSYTIAVMQLPIQLGKEGGTIDRVKSNTILKRNKKPAIGPDDVQVVQDGERTVRVEFSFPKTDPIVSDDKEVEFVTKMGDVEIKKKFKLADMMVRGLLAL